MSTHPAPLTPALIDYAIKTRALDEQAIVTRTSTRRFLISPTARLISIITSPADQAGLWGVAHSRLDQTAPTLVATGDPGAWAGQHELFDKLGQQWGMWIKTSMEAGHLPQLIIPTHQAAEALTWAATRITTHPKAAPTARLAAALILNGAHLSRTAGSNAHLTVLEALREHYTTPLDVEAETHLGVWVDYPTVGENSRRSFTSLDEEHTAADTGLGKAFDKMHALEGDRRISRAARLVPLLTPHLASRHADLQAALTLLTAHPGPDAPYLADRAQADVGHLARALAGPYTPNPGHLPAAIRTLTERESALDAVTKTLWATDSLERARAVASGDVLEGTPQDGAEFVTTHPAPRARPGDTCTNLATGKTHTVETIQAVNSGTAIIFTPALPDTTDAPLVLSPALTQTPSRWVKETWVTTGQHTATPNPTPAPAVGDKGWGQWAESLKT